jgi:hypothetical protein
MLSPCAHSPSQPLGKVNRTCSGIPEALKCEEFDGRLAKI